MIILILKTSALGDLIHTFPVLSYLRKKYPHAQIDWVVEKAGAELIQAHPEVNQVLKIDSKKPFLRFIQNLRHIFRNRFYDIVFDLQGNLKSSIILTQIKARSKVGFGWKTVREWPNAFFTKYKFNPPLGKNIREDYLYIVQSYFKDNTPFQVKPIALQLTQHEQEQVNKVLSDATLVCLGAAWPNKQLSLAQMTLFLQKLNHKPYLFVWGSEKERQACEALATSFQESKVLEKYTLPALQHIMAKSKLVIAMDSLPLHLCSTTLTRSMSFFGPTSAKKFGAMGERHQVIQGKCPFGMQFQKTCPKLRSCKSGCCLKGLTTRDLK